MKKKLLAILLSAIATVSILPFQAFGYYVETSQLKVVQGVNFREQPSTSGDKIRMLKTGELLELIQTYNNNWLLVRDAAGQTGYVSSSSTYVKETKIKVPAEPNATIVSSVSFRTGPSTSSTRTRFLKEGEQVLILEKVNSYWYRVMDANENTGYVSTSSQYIETYDNQEPALEEEKEEELFQAPPNGTIVSSVSFRTGPGTDDPRIRYLSAGEKVLVLDKYNDYWYNVQDQNGTVGYVSTSAKYISTAFVEPYKQLNRMTAAEQVIQAGMSYMGVPYEFGSNRNDTSTFDCSDFVRQAFLDGIGQQLPGNSRTQGSYVRSIGGSQTDWRQLQRGDLMFFMSYKGSKASNYSGIDKSSATITHVGIYLGNGQVLHTYSEESGGVRIDSIAGTSWEHRFLFGGHTY
ncbi:Cell wall-associated hydrolase, NlpC family [Paenibacillus sp. UNCCL117]|uniref:C40 family peptidase n=1 Tax=unclassified Paenibacillus TaxID=185978 RepID=UPI00088A3F81|nr:MULTISPECIES: C40 family peptidase [unclassified Paenibacillus]SDE16358.1 Cell wall-associated hydrolase, NlpC family [Paenibacillus sp. cl123]SFW61141.1 Cell wall-associated hydrolase, NlpC family [Paenibacillus sp. UNCCL117]